MEKHNHFISFPYIDNGGGTGSLLKFRYVWFTRILLKKKKSSTISLAFRILVGPGPRPRESVLARTPLLQCAVLARFDLSNHNITGINV